jgi:hypothetical protein
VSTFSMARWGGKLRRQGGHHRLRPMSRCRLRARLTERCISAPAHVWGDASFRAARAVDWRDELAPPQSAGLSNVPYLQTESGVTLKPAWIFD